jgi:hypothetical protein
VIGFTSGINSSNRETSSTYRESFGTLHKQYDPNSARPGQHKPLVKYHPNAARNRLRTDDVKMEHPNKHHSDFADGANQSTKHRFKTQYMVAYTGQAGPLPSSFTSNQGIVAEKTAYLHKQQLK